MSRGNSGNGATTRLGPDHRNREPATTRSSKRERIAEIISPGSYREEILRVLWEKEFAGKVPASLGRDILALAIAYARQERHYGGLARPVAKELDRLLARVLRDEATDAPKSPTSLPLPRTGTILVREWRGTIPPCDRGG